MTKTTLALVLVCAACGGKARKPDVYRADTERVLTSRNSQLQGCYEEALKSDSKLAGTIKVAFVIEKKTGVIRNAQIVPATAAATPLGTCVLQALDGLKLEPADRQEGRATFEYAFQPRTSS